MARMGPEALMRFAIAAKRSKWERDYARYGSRTLLRKMYAVQNDTWERVYSSHRRQKIALRHVREALSDSIVVFREELPHFDFRSVDAVISLGGDNHFVFVTHFADRVPLIGINSDPLTSAGALLQFDADRFIRDFQNAGTSPHLVTTEWTRIEGMIEYPDGRKTKIGPATSEISIRNSFPDAISRFLVRMNDEPWEEQKNSGLLLSTGTGSTGWFRNALPDRLQESAPFPRDSAFFRGVARESGERRNYRCRFPEVPRGGWLDLVSEMEGEITADAHPEVTIGFPPGTKARFSLSAQNLVVVTQIQKA